MLSNSPRFNVRNILRLVLFATVVIHLLDAGVDASKSRKRRNKHRRSKRTHGDRTERRKNRKRIIEPEEIEIIEDGQPTLVNLVKAQQKLRHSETKVPVVDEVDIYKDIQSSLIRKYLENRKKNKPQVEDDRVTVLPVVHATVDFLIKREKSQYFNEPSTTIGGINPSELGLVSAHTAQGKYGLHSSAQRIFGRLIHIEDAGRSQSHFGCGNAVSNRHDIPKNNQPWIALIQRGHCAFFTKIKLAERNNASAVIIYDNENEEVPKMNTIGTKIVSVAISKHDGHKIARLTDSGTRVMVNIEVTTNPLLATKPDITTSVPRLEPEKPDVISSVTRIEHDFRTAYAGEDPGNGAKTNNGIIITSLLTALLAVLLQNMTS